MFDVVRRQSAGGMRKTFLPVTTLTLSIALFCCFIVVVDGQVYYEEEDICDSVKCSCDCTTKTLECHRLTFEYLPIFPRWVETLQLDGNHLTLLRDYSFVNLTNLKHLSFSGNDLEYIYPQAFAGLINLESLDLSNNRISHLIKETFRDLKQLNRLNLSGNKFNDLSLFGNLFDVRTSSSSMTSSPNRTFVEINLGFNQFSHCEESVHLPFMKKLTLRGAKLYAFTGQGLILAPNDDENLMNKSVNVDIFEHLDELDISNCQAELYPEFIDRVKNVIRLNIGGNHVSPYVLRKLSSFHRLEYLNVNNIRTSVDNWDIFPPAIKELDVSNLKLTSINFTYFPYVSDFEILRASNNKFQDFSLTNKLFTLKRLDLSDNELTSVPRSLKYMKFIRLEFIDLSGNRLSSLSFNSLASFPSLTTLLLTNNKILTLDKRTFYTTPNLQTLDVSFNLLSHLFSMDLTRLIVFNASNNRLVDLDWDFFGNTPSLRVLDLSYNEKLFDNVSCRDMSSSTTTTSKISTCKNPDWFENIILAKQLVRIRMSHSNVERLPKRFFSSFVNLTDLNFGGNLINDTTLDETVTNLQRIPCIKSFNFSSNRITHFNNLSLLLNPCLDFVDVSRNPYTCDCKMQPLIDILKSFTYSEISLYNESLYYCFSTKNNWRYPMYEFINTVQPCNVHASFNALTLLLYIFVGLVSTVLATVFCRLCVVAVRKGVLHSQYIYRPLQLFTEDPTNLVQL